MCCPSLVLAVLVSRLEAGKSTLEAHQIGTSVMARAYQANIESFGGAHVDKKFSLLKELSVTSTVKNTRT
jgi:hypothetical protein